MTDITIDQFIRVIEDGGFGFSPSIIAVPYLTAELGQRGIHLSTLETHAFLEQITSHFRYGKIKWLGKAEQRQASCKGAAKTAENACMHLTSCPSSSRSRWAWRLRARSLTS